MVPLVNRCRCDGQIIRRTINKWRHAATVKVLHNMIANLQKEKMLALRLVSHEKMLRKAAMTLLRRRLVFALRDILSNFEVFQNKGRGEKIMRRAGARMLMKAAGHLLVCIWHLLESLYGSRFPHIIAGSPKDASKLAREYA